MPLTPEQIQQMDGITGMGGAAAPAAGGSSLTPEQIAQMDEITGASKPQGMYAKREANAQKIADDVVNDKISPVSGVLQGVGQAAGLVGDFGGKALEMAAHGAATMYPNATKVAKGLIKPIAESETLKAGAQKVGQVYGDIKKAHPEAVGNAEAIANIASVLPVGKAVEMAAPLLKPAASAVNKAGGAVVDAVVPIVKDPISAMERAITPKPKMVMPERPEARQWYKKLRDMKVSFTPDESQKIAFNLDKLVPKDAGEAAVFNKSGIQNNIDMIKGAMKEEPLSFTGAQALRADLNSELKMAYNTGDGTRALHLERVKDELSAALQNPTGNAKGLEASNAWQMANHEFQIESILGDIDLIAAKASGKAQPANSLDTAINNYLNNKKLSAGLRPDERAALEAVTEKTQTGEWLKTGATRLAPMVGGAVGGAPGFIIGHYGSMLSRTTAEALKLKKLQAAYDLINARKPPTQIGPWGGGSLYDKGRAKFEASKGK